MKSYVKFFSASLLVAMALTGCRDEYEITGGEGSLSISATVNSSTEIISRALSAEEENALAESAVIWISNEKGLVHEFVGASNVPSSLRLLSGHYTGEAWVGDSVPASWDKVFYKSGFTPFDIKSGVNTELTLACRVANTLASVKYLGAALDVLESPVMTVSLEDGITDGSHSLEFAGETDAKGYFMINSRTKGLRWTLSGVQADGSVFTKEGLIENIKPTTEYVLNVKYTASQIEIGGAFFEIEVEEEPVGDETEVEIVMPPLYTGLLGFDETRTYRGQEGEIGRKSVFISAAAELKHVEVTSAAFVPVAGTDKIGLMDMGESIKAQLAAAHINWTYSYDPERDLSNLRFNLDEEFTNSLPEGEHTFAFAATDIMDRESEATFTIVVSNAPVASLPVDESTVTYTSATLTGAVVKEASEYGFYIRKASAARSYEDWTKVPGTVTDGKVTATVNDLTPGVEYEFTVYADTYVTPSPLKFVTKTYQLPNAGFEDWQASSAPYLIYAAGQDMFWDSGNHGSATMSKNVTVPDATYKHSGNRSIKLASQFVGLGALGKFAAGNVFIGKYLDTQGTDGVLGWGRPWPVDIYPKALRVWVKYSPVAVTHDNSSYADLKKGDMDKGIIYLAFLDESTDTRDPNYSGWPVVIETKTKQLFDKNGANVIAYGEKVFDSATAGNDLVEVIIPIDYKADKSRIRNIMLVGSASIGGDYFVGGNGSSLWIDDLEFIY